MSIINSDKLVEHLCDAQISQLLDGETYSIVQYVGQGFWLCESLASGKIVKFHQDYITGKTARRHQEGN